MTFRKMKLRKAVLFLITLGTVAALIGCSSSSSRPTSIAVTLNRIGTSLPVNSQTAVVASVTNDPAMAGVTWSCSPAATCGTFSPTATASGASSVYTAPAVIATDVTITATSVTNSAVKVNDSGITITPATLADGTYVFQLSGVDAFDQSVYSVSGAFTIASGAITGGEQDFVDSQSVLSDQINPTGSTVTTSTDGNLLVTLTTCNGTDCTATDTILGPSNSGIETLDGSVTPLNPNKFLITQYDSSATSSGELIVQNAAAAAATPSGGYAFGLSGVDSSDDPLTMGGIINVDDLGGTTGTISGAGGIFDANDDENDFPAETFTASTVTAPDSFGRLTFTLNPSDTTDFPEIVLVGYIVDSTRIRLVESLDNFAGAIGGTAFAQGTNTGTFTAASVSGSTYVAGLSGGDSNGVLQVAGQLTFNADNSISGFINYNDLTGLGPQTPSTLTGGTWAEDVATGRVTLTGVTDGKLKTPVDLQLYLDGNGNLTTISLDSTDVLGGRGFLQSGGSNFAATSFAGAYANGVTGVDANFGDEFDAVGPDTADGVGAFMGYTDLNWVFSAIPTFPNDPVAGTFTPAMSAPFTGTVAGIDLATCRVYDAGPGCTYDVFAYYLINATGDNISIETDQLQLTLGYFTQH